MDPEPKNMMDFDSPLNRKIAWVMRDKESYCYLHPQLHPSNDEQIRWVEGTTVTRDKKGEVVERHTFMFCPKCHHTVSLAKEWMDEVNGKQRWTRPTPVKVS